MKIISWNINGIRAVERKGALQECITKHQPDILLLQEIKGKPNQFSNYLLHPPDYEAWYHPAERPGYSGTSIWIKKSLTVTNINFIIHPEVTSNEGRIARVDFQWKGKDFSVFGIYFPNGGKSSEAWKKKLQFYETLLADINQLREKGRECIWGGDVNCAHEPIDLARPEENDGVIGFHPEERQRISQIITNDWVDIWRKTHPEVAEVYSWWHVITRARERNIGWRIDYFFCDAKFFPRIKNIEYLTQQMGSDHCPISIEIS